MLRVDVRLSTGELKTLTGVLFTKGGLGSYHHRGAIFANYDPEILDLYAYRVMNRPRVDYLPQLTIQKCMLVLVVIKNYDFQITELAQPLHL